MSDANAGDVSSKRPGMDVNRDRNAAKDGGQGGNGKGKRSRRDQGGIQADNSTGGSQSASAGDLTVSKNGESLDGAPKSKRARRRRGRRKKPSKSPDHGQQPEAGQPVETPVNATKSKDRNHHRRRVRRPNRRASIIEDANGVAPDAKTSKPAQSNQTQRAASKQIHRPAHPRDVYAALDLGTNNCRLLVAIAQQPGRFRVIDAYSRIVRLGEGLAGSGRLNEAAMDRAVEALKACADKLSNRTVKKFRLIATEACRRADNGVEFLKRVQQESGLDLEIIDRETEARLAVAGCTSLFDRQAKGAVLFDIGGGSSELALLDLRKRRRHDFSQTMVSWTSLPLGVVTLSERHGGGKLVTRKVFDDMVEEVSEILDNFEGRHELAEAGKEGEVHLLGTSGTVTTLAGIHLKLPRYDRRQVDGVWMQSDVVDNMIDELVSMDFEQRVANPCIGRERADLVLAGCAILVAIKKHWPCERLRVADRGLREGLLTDMMNADNAWDRRSHRPNRRKR